MSAAGGGPDPKTPIINSILEPRFCISLNVHGAYDRKEYTTGPPNLVIIEMGLPSQSVYARFYDYMYAIFVDPINLDFLYTPKFTMADFVRDRENVFKKDITRAKRSQEAIIRGDYDFFYKNPYYEGLTPEQKFEFQAKLEMLDKIIRKVTIYTEGDIILGRSLKVYDLKGFDATCTIDVSDPNLNPVKWEKDKFFNPILEGITENRSLAEAVTTTQVINYLTNASPMKLIIFTCGHVTKNLDDITLELANEADALRAAFYKERIDNSGPSPITSISDEKSSDPYPQNWCISYKDTSSVRTLRAAIEEFGPPANVYGGNSVTSTQTLGNKQSQMPDSLNQSKEKITVICSRDRYEYDRGITTFLYTFLSPGLPRIIIPGTELEFEGAPLDKPFIFLTFTELITEYSELYDSLYLISKGDNVLYKVADIFDKYITKDEINEWILKDKDILDLYTRLAAKYIMQPFQIDGDKNLGKHVMDFKTFRDIAGGIVTQLTIANKLLSEIESLYEDDPDNRSRYYQGYLDTLAKYKDTEVVDLILDPKPALPPTGVDLSSMRESTIGDISKFIELYIRYSYGNIKFIVDISAYATPSDIEAATNHFFIKYSEVMREYLLSQLIAKGGGGAGGAAGGGARAAMNERKRKTRKARTFKNRKSLRKKNKQ